MRSSTIAILGSAATVFWNAERPSSIASTSVCASTVAVRGAPSSSAISPNESPGLRCTERLPGGFTTALPSRMT